MEAKLKERLFRNHAFPTLRGSAKAYRGIAGMTSKNVAGISVEPVVREQSRSFSAYVAEIEIKRAQTLAEAHRLSLR